jgi:hypothetical protein
MKPRSISASSINNFEECPAKFKASNILRVPEVGPKTPAMIGTSVHYALEHFVRKTCMDKTDEWSLKLLEKLYHEGYIDTFGNADTGGDAYKDGLAMARSWFRRQHEMLGGVEVLSVEQKVQIPVRASRTKESALLTFIFDRAETWEFFDDKGQVKRAVRVVDYKSQREYVSPEQMREHRQARIYALAAAVMYRHLKPDEIWVQLDLLRYSPVEALFTREDNEATRDYLRETLQIIHDTDEVNPPRRLTKGCGYCPVKMTCGEHNKNVGNGGDLSLTDPATAAALYEELEGAAKLIEEKKKVISRLLIDFAKEVESTDFETDRFVVTVKTSARREVDAYIASKVVGPEIAGKISSITMKNVDTLLKGDLLSEQQKAELNKLITRTYGAPTISVKRKAIT